ncbi:MAG: hypothetical protein HYU66_01755 [Armatimonadetes bacterium]|nr:hypothetical protein [Armatimonadota bacterium]
MTLAAAVCGWGLVALAWRHGLHLVRGRCPARWFTLASPPLVAAVWFAGCEACGAACPALLPVELALPLSLLVFGLLALAARAPETWLRRPLVVVTALVTLWVLPTLAGPWLLHTGVWELDGERLRGDVSQSTWWSCGPAAVASLAHHRGLAMSEAEAARAACTWPGLGSFPAGLCHALREAGLPARVHWGFRLDDLRPGQRGVAYVRVSGRVIHAVAVLDVGDDRVSLFCPTFGPSRARREKLAGDWLGLFIEAGSEPPDGNHPARGAWPATPTSPRRAQAAGARF